MNKKVKSIVKIIISCCPSQQSESLKTCFWPPFEFLLTQTCPSIFKNISGSKSKETFSRFSSVPALYDGLLHSCTFLWWRSPSWVLAHHRQELKQQFGALCLPCAWFTTGGHTHTHNSIKDTVTFSDIPISQTGSFVQSIQSFDSFRDISLASSLYQ